MHAAAFVVRPIDLLIHHHHSLETFNKVIQYIVVEFDFRVPHVKDSHVEQPATRSIRKDPIFITPYRSEGGPILSEGGSSMWWWWW